ncbi:uncharacterized protein LOC131329002 isoform X2 [Rhododendron vialii]|uniref:uncharacterized protein LOC131329002 isoform X2 n=1 Tax=Rhododendron vialii TaxID=182163 RepID=UPI00265F3DB3|nr:uncharacterized protein LOC131329002 isoform X2 [Rhododendron vialii]
MGARVCRRSKVRDTKRSMSIGFCLRVASICQVMPSPNGSEHVLSSCGEENYAKEHLERGHCIDEANVHDDNSLDRRNGRMRFSEFHGFLRLLPLPVFSFPQRCSLRSRDRVFVLPRKSNKACYGSGSRREVAALTIKCQEERTSRVAPNGRSKRRRVSTNQTVINSDVYMNLEVSSGSMASFTVC